MIVTALQIRRCALTKFLAWERWWCRPSPPHLMGIVRIVIGGWLLCYWAIRFPNIDILFSDRGIVFPVFPAYLPEQLVFLWDIPSLAVVRIVYGILLLSLASLTVGFCTRTSALLSFLCAVWFWYLQIHLFHTSFDRLYLYFQLVLAFSGAGETFSVQAYRRYGSFTKSKNMISIFPQRLLAVQIMFTYLGVGWQKLWLPDWQGGEMLWYAMIGVWGTDLAYAVASLGFSSAYHSIVSVVKLFEIVLPFVLWVRWQGIRFWAMGSGAVFHLLIGMLLSIWWFLVLIPAYIVFLTPEEVHVALRRATRAGATSPSGAFLRCNSRANRRRGGRGDRE